MHKQRIILYLEKAAAAGVLQEKMRYINKEVRFLYFNLDALEDVMTEKDIYLAILKELFSLIRALELDGASTDMVEQLKEIYNDFSFFVKA